MFNISMLKKVFNPTFELHDIKQTGEYEATTRWCASHNESENLTPCTLTCAFLHLAMSLLSSPARLTSIVNHMWRHSSKYTFGNAFALPPSRTDAVGK